MVRRMIPCSLNPPCMHTGAGSKEGDFLWRFLLKVSREWVQAMMVRPSHTTLSPYDDHSPSSHPAERKGPTKVRTTKFIMLLSKQICNASLRPAGFWLSLTFYRRPEVLHLSSQSLSSGTCLQPFPSTCKMKSLKSSGRGILHVFNSLLLELCWKCVSLLYIWPSSERSAQCTLPVEGTKDFHCHPHCCSKIKVSYERYSLYLGKIIMVKIMTISIMVCGLLITDVRCSAQVLVPLNCGDLHRQKHLHCLQMCWNYCGQHWMPHVNRCSINYRKSTNTTWEGKFPA